MSTSVLYHAFQIEGVKYTSTSFEGKSIINIYESVRICHYN